MGGLNRVGVGEWGLELQQCNVVGGKEAAGLIHVFLVDVHLEYGNALLPLLALGAEVAPTGQDERAGVPRHTLDAGGGRQHPAGVDDGAVANRVLEQPQRGHPQGHLVRELVRRRSLAARDHRLYGRTCRQDTGFLAHS